MNKRMRVIFSISLFLSLKICVAQYVPMSSTIRTPYGNVNSTTYRYVPMYYGSGQASVKYKFTVVLKSDSVITANTKIDISEKQHSLRVKTSNGKKDLVPNNTKELYRITSTGKKLSGIPADSCWLFKSVAGRINTYSHLAMEGYDFIICIQKGDSAPILPLTKKIWKQS